MMCTDWYVLYIHIIHPMALYRFNFHHGVHFFLRDDMRPAWDDEMCNMESNLSMQTRQ